MKSPKEFCYKLVIAPVVSHLNVLLEHFDPVKEGKCAAVKPAVAISDVGENPKRAVPSCNRQYIWPALSIILCYLYGTFGLVDQLSIVSLHLRQFQQSPLLYYHQLFPRAVWPQMDVIVLTYALTSSCMYVKFMLTPSIDERFQMFYNGQQMCIGSKSINPGSSRPEFSKLY